MIPPLQPGQIYLIEMYATTKDLHKLYELLPELLKAAKQMDCKLIIGDEPFIWQPDEPRPASIYDGVIS